MNKWPYSTYSKVDSSVKRHFPFDTARQNQLETISEIKNAIDRGYKYIILEAGTGTGKSAIAATLASMYDSTYILTVTKQLQDQYLKDFKDLGFRLVKGRGNFPCRKYLQDKIKLNCDEGRCIREGYRCEFSLKNNDGADITKVGLCHYDYQKYLGLISKVVITNYAYLFLELNYVEDFSKRKLMVFDEAHNLENAIMNQLKLEFDRKELKEYIGVNLSKETVNYLKNGDYHTWIQFIEKINEKYIKEFNKIKHIKSKPELFEKINYLKKRIDDCNIFINHIRHDPKKWIFDYDSHWGIAQFKPVKIDKYAKSTFLRYGDVCLFMSATILDYKLFAEWLGIREDEVYAIRQKSPFEINRNPIKTFKGFPMSYKTLDEIAPTTIDTIQEILDKHKNDKGIIHTVSYSCKNFLKKKIDTDRLIDHRTHNRARKLRKFKKSKKPLVLISPSMNEGVDLPGDLCRFQIIYKIPYPNVSDKQTSFRMRLDPKWFKYKTCLSLVQTVGRGMRYEDDYCMTYFIDSRLKNFIMMDEITDNFLPEPFRQAIDIEPAKIEKTPEITIKKEEKSIPVENNVEELFSRVMEVKPSHDEPISDTKQTPYEKMVSEKFKLISKGKKLMENNKLDEAAEFYTGLINHELFKNDYHQYLKLTKVYSRLGYYEKELQTITDFFKSGVYVRKSKIRWFKKQLKKLCKLGYAEYSIIDELEDEFSKKGAFNKNLSDKPVPWSYYLIRSNKNENKNSVYFSPDDFKSITQIKSNASYDEKVNFKRDLIVVGDRLMALRAYDRLIGFYLNLLNHELFRNDYYIYRKLAIVCHKNHNYKKVVRIITEFFSSGIYCDSEQIKWFEKKLKTTSKYGTFDYSTLDDLKEKFKKGGALNKHKINEPVLCADEITDTLDPLEIKRTPKVEFHYDDKPKLNFKNGKYVPKKITAEIRKNSLGKYSRPFFNELAKGISDISGFVSDRDLLNHKDEDFCKIRQNYSDIARKAELISKGKELERENEKAAVEFYDTLKENELFRHDYYPYRRQCILYKNKIKDNQRDLDTILDLLANDIYLNRHQYIWLKNKLFELIDKLNLNNQKAGSIIEKIDEHNYKRNLSDIHKDSIPISERIFKKDNSIKLLSKEKFDLMQDIFFIKEMGLGYIRRKEYEIAISYYVNLLNDDFLYFRYHAYKQLGRIFQEMDDYDNFKRFFEKKLDDCQENKA